MIVSEEDEEAEREESIDHLVSLLPKRNRRRARIILSSSGIRFQPKSLRVLYNDDGETVVGSHLLDLLQATMAPSFIQQR